MKWHVVAVKSVCQDISRVVAVWRQSAWTTASFWLTRDEVWGCCCWFVSSTLLMCVPCSGNRELGSVSFVVQSQAQGKRTLCSGLWSCWWAKKPIAPCKSFGTPGSFLFWLPPWVIMHIWEHCAMFSVENKSLSPNSRCYIIFPPFTWWDLSWHFWNLLSVDLQILNFKYVASRGSGGFNTFNSQAEIK